MQYKQSRIMGHKALEIKKTTSTFADNSKSILAIILDRTIKHQKLIDLQRRN